MENLSQEYLYLRFIPQITDLRYLTNYIIDLSNATPLID